MKDVEKSVRHTGIIIFECLIAERLSARQLDDACVQTEEILLWCCIRFEFWNMHTLRLMTTQIARFHKTACLRSEMQLTCALSQR